MGLMEEKVDSLLRVGRVVQPTPETKATTESQQGEKLAAN